MVILSVMALIMEEPLNKTNHRHEPPISKHFESAALKHDQIDAAQASGLK
jgi:hypothetical protein